MDLKDGVKRINGIIEVEVQGFFTERFINLCKINNITIWNIKNIVSGIVRFSIALKDFKKLKPIARKTKCKIKIISKNGLYFKLFKYRKRKFALLLIILFLVLSIFSTMFIWSVDITGNTYVSEEDIQNVLSDAGVSKGKLKIGLSSKRVSNYLRVNLQDIAWAGVVFDGTHVHVKVVEKTRLPSEAVKEERIGDIISDKSGTIEKIVVENGTAIPKEQDYVESGRILIEGKIYSDLIGTKDVSAKGTIRMNTTYEYNNNYSYKYNEKEYTGKNKYSIGITINNKENYIKCLDKSLNYDIIKHSKKINIFGNDIELSWYKFEIYNLIEKERTSDEIIELAKQDANNYLNNEVLVNAKNGVLKNSNIIQDSSNPDYLNVKVVFEVTEDVGYFKERN